MKRTASKGTLRRVLALLRGSGWQLVLALILSAANVAGTLYVPIAVGRAIDCVVAPGQVELSAAARALAGALVAACGAAALQWCISDLFNRMAFSAVRDVRRQAFAKLQRLPLSYLDAHPSGDTLSRIIADADQLSDGLVLGFSQFFTGALTILCTLVIMLRLSWRIALVVVLLTPLSLFAAKFITGRTKTLFTAQSRLRGQQTAYLEEMVGEQKLVRAFGMEARSAARFDEENDRLRDASLQAMFFSSLTNPVTRFVNAMVYAGVALVGALSAAGGAVTVGTLTVFLSYANQYTRPFNEISGVIAELQNALACAARLFELLDAPDETPSAPASLPTPVSGGVRLRDVSFSYVPQRPLIEHLELNVQPGQRVAVVGPTGCGKTTLINLLMRFYDVSGGAIYVDGTDVYSVSRRSLRAQYGMVLQETWLSGGTVRENLTMGAPDATDEELFEAARACYADDFIRKLPQGYDTPLSGGVSLSQGQRQLLCITRVMLAKPPMLILDEATSSIDTRTERKVQAAFAALMRGRTSFIVAHRLSTIREADVILVMRDGHIIEQGRHEQLLEKGGFYAKLYNSQFEQ